MKRIITTWNTFFGGPQGHWLRDIGLLLGRLGIAGLLAFQHGWPKIAEFEERSTKFADPLGIGIVASLSLAIFAELFCSLAVMAGFLTRLAILPIIPTMFIASRVAAGGGNATNSELATLFLIGFVTLLFTGPGRISLDHAIGRNFTAR